MSVSIPALLVVIACKATILPSTDPNDKFTHHENIQWVTENSMMVCQRHEIPLIDPVEGLTVRPGDKPLPGLTPNFTDWSQCQRAAMDIETKWDNDNRGGPWRVWRIGCPVPIVDDQTGNMIGYKMPECGHQDTIVCLVDSSI